jgi:hypothetical protein
MAALAACSQRATVASGVSGGPLDDPGIELPAGPGGELLRTRCLGCHDLGGLELFKGFYSRDDWHRLIETMVAHGAAVDAVEVEIVADYLALNFGRQP